MKLYKRIGIELDGTQHLKTTKQDKERDDFMLTENEITIYRISHKDYQAKTKIDLVKKLLDIK